MSEVFDGKHSQSQIDDIFDMYGDLFDDDEKVFPVYEDIDFGQGTFNMGKDYILDGMGHTIKMKPQNNGTLIRIGPCRDIYLTDDNGNTIYISGDGKVYKVNSYGSMDFVQDLPPLKGNAYQIDLATGRVIQS